MIKLFSRILVVVASIICLSAASAQEVDYSGPQPSERLPKLEVVDAFETDGERPYDVIARVGADPSILVVIHDMLGNKSDEPSLGLAYVLMHYAATRADSGLKRNLVFLADDRQEMKKFLTKVRRALPKKETPIVISTAGLEGPGSWGFNRNLRMTIVIANEGKATANLALQQPSVNVDTPKVLRELVKVIGGEEPKLKDLDFPYYIGKPSESDK